MSSTITALTSGGGLAMAGDTSGQLELKVNNGTTAVTVDTSGNMGIGTTSPSSFNQRVSAPQLVVGNGTNSSGITLYSASANQSSVNFAYGTTTTQQYDGGLVYAGISGGSPYMSFSVNGGVERMRIDSSGNLFVGTTNTASGGFEVSPDYNSTLSSAFIVGHASGSASGAVYGLFRYGANSIGSITQTGTTAVLYNTTSDYRLKTDVTPIQNALATVKVLNPVRFTWVDGRLDNGFIAHELQAIIPNCVTGEKDAVNEDGTPKYQQMDNSGVIPFLVKAIQELNDKVDAQAATITALQAKVGN